MDSGAYFDEEWLKESAAKQKAYNCQCDCGKPARVLFVKKQNQNHGRPFFRCSIKKEEGGCEFFEFADTSKFNPLPVKRPLEPSTPASTSTNVHSKDQLIVLESTIRQVRLEINQAEENLGQLNKRVAELEQVLQSVRLEKRQKTNDEV